LAEERILAVKKRLMNDVNIAKVPEYVEQGKTGRVVLCV
jgi:hypothetical protein